MSLIFDRFPNREQADAFQKAVAARFPQHQTHLWMRQDEMESLFDRQLHGKVSEQELEIEADMFPWVLEAPIVLVSRSEDGEHEAAIEQMVTRFGGTWAGT